MTGNAFQPSQLELTFGIELEGQVAEKGGHVVRREDLIQHLNHAGFNTICASEEQESWINENYQSWSIGHDSSIKAFGQNTTFELVSRVMPATEVGMDEIREVVSALTDKFDLIADSSTGFHVHFGNGFFGFPLRTMLNLSLVVVAFEHLIDGIHAPSRLSSVAKTHSFAASPRSLVWMRERTTIYQKLTGLATCSTYKQLLEIMTGGDHDTGSRYSAYNFQCMLGDGARLQKRTIEFRQHEGTFSVEKITAWCYFLRALMTFSHRADNGEIGELLSHVDDDHFGLFDLFDYLNVGFLKNHYHINTHHRRLTLSAPSPTVPSPSGQKMLQAALLYRESLMLETEARWETEGMVPSWEAASLNPPHLLIEKPWIPWSENPFRTPRINDESRRKRCTCEQCKELERMFDCTMEASTEVAYSPHLSSSSRCSTLSPLLQHHASEGSYSRSIIDEMFDSAVLKRGEASTSQQSRGRDGANARVDNADYDVAGAGYESSIADQVSSIHEVEAHEESSEDDDSSYWDLDDLYF